MEKTIIWLLAIAATFFFLYLIYLLVCWGRAIYLDLKFNKSNPTIEQRHKRFQRLVKETQKENLHPPILPHLKDFSKSENIIIAWEKKGSEFQETFFQKQS